MNHPDRPRRILYRIASGNVEGFIEELDDPDSDDPLRVPKIGVLNSREPSDEDDTRYVIDQLRAFVTSLASRVSF